MRGALCVVKEVVRSALFFFFFFKQKTAYEIVRWTGVQTCALPICFVSGQRALAFRNETVDATQDEQRQRIAARSEERRVGKEGRPRGSPHHHKKKRKDHATRHPNGQKGGTRHHRRYH